MKKLYGVITAMVTPFDSAGEVDIAAMKRLAEFLVARKVNCLYPTGTTGEMLLLSVEERKKIAEAVVETAAGRVTAYIHAGAMNQRDTIDLARHAKSIGADGIGVVTPSFFSVNERELEEFYVAVSRSVPEDFPVYLYNIPQCSGNDLKTHTVEKIIGRCPNIVGIKYSYPDFIRVGEYLRVAGGDFSVVIGADRLFLPGLVFGCAGTVSGISSVCPEPFVAIYDAYKRGDFAEARRIQTVATRICELLKNGSNMAYFKAALHARGIEVGHMRKPLLDLPAGEAEAIGPALSALLESISVPMLV